VSRDLTPFQRNAYPSNQQSGVEIPVRDSLPKKVSVLPDELRIIDQLLGGEIAKLFEE